MIVITISPICITLTWSHIWRGASERPEQVELDLSWSHRWVTAITLRWKWCRWWQQCWWQVIPLERRDVYMCSRWGRSSRRFHLWGQMQSPLLYSLAGSSSSSQPLDNTLKMMTITFLTVWVRSSKSNADGYGLELRYRYGSIECNRWFEQP